MWYYLNLEATSLHKNIYRLKKSEALFLTLTLALTLFVDPPGHELFFHYAYNQFNTEV